MHPWGIEESWRARREEHRAPVGCHRAPRVRWRALVQPGLERITWYLGDPTFEYRGTRQGTAADSAAGLLCRAPGGHARYVRGSDAQGHQLPHRAVSRWGGPRTCLCPALVDALKDFGYLTANEAERFENCLKSLPQALTVQGRTCVFTGGTWQTRRLPTRQPRSSWRQVDLIVALEGQTIRAAQAATTTVPVVFLHAADPVDEGLIQSLSHPGGNMTGLIGSTARRQATRGVQEHPAEPAPGARGHEPRGSRWTRISWTTSGRRRGPMTSPL